MTESETIDGVKILKGPPVPSVLPAKGVGLFVESKKLQWFVLSQFNNSDTVVRTPVSFFNALKFFRNCLRGN